MPAYRASKYIYKYIYQYTHKFYKYIALQKPVFQISYPKMGYFIRRKLRIYCFGDSRIDYSLVECSAYHIQMYRVQSSITINILLTIITFPSCIAK